MLGWRVTLSGTALDASGAKVVILLQRNHYPPVKDVNEDKNYRNQTNASGNHFEIIDYFCKQNMAERCRMYEV